MKSLLSKLLPFDRILSLALKLGILARPLELAAKGWKKAQGVRTQGSLVVAVLVGAAASLGYVPWDVAKPLINALVGVAGAAVMEKLNNLLPQVEKISEAVAEEARQLDERGK